MHWQRRSAWWWMSGPGTGRQLDADEELLVVAPHGLSDQFEMRVRHNPHRVSFEAFLRRI
ncbi:nucleotidyltransferase family protein [Comamonas odontotermitis]|uniref:nucleotidyltransferase family protein n=1 Tax=Comamonas odontotermitis TaxID=379895 RepID=UPI003AEF49DD